MIKKFFTARDFKAISKGDGSGTPTIEKKAADIANAKFDSQSCFCVGKYHVTRGLRGDRNILWITNNDGEAMEMGEQCLDNIWKELL